MSKIVILILSLLSHTGHDEYHQSARQIHHKPRIIMARVTYYCCGEDKYGSRVADPKVRRARQGITVAAEPQFPFETHIDIKALSFVLPSEHFLIQDRGTAVTARKASHGKTPVFDVYATPRMARRLASTMPEFLPVTIY